MTTNQSKCLKGITQNVSEDSFRDEVSMQNVNNYYNDVNEKCNDFYIKLEACVERHTTLKKLTPKEIKLENKPWII